MGRRRNRKHAARTHVDAETGTDGKAAASLAVTLPAPPDKPRLELLPERDDEEDAGPETKRPEELLAQLPLEQEEPAPWESLAEALPEPSGVVAVPADRPSGTRAACVSLDVEIDESSDSCFFAPLSGDVADGGVFVSTWRLLAVGSEVELVLSMPNGEAIARGVVRFCRDASESSPPGLGVALQDLDDAARSLIDEVCAVRPPRYYEVELDVQTEQRGEAAAE